VVFELNNFYFAR